MVNEQSGGVNLQNLIGEQIVFIEPSPAQQKIEELKRLGQVFIDESFPPNQASLVGEYTDIDDIKGVKWAKVTEVMKNPVLFNGKIGPQDIQQGKLGDCYFLAGLAALV